MSETNAPERLYLGPTWLEREGPALSIPDVPGGEPPLVEYVRADLIRELEADRARLDWLEGWMAVRPFRRLPHPQSGPCPTSLREFVDIASALPPEAT